MLLNGSVLGSLFGGVGSALNQQNSQINNANSNTNKTDDQTVTENKPSNSVSGATETADSGGAKFDFSSAVSNAASTTGNTVGSVVSAAANGTSDSGASGSNSSAAPSQAEDDSMLSAYFYAAKWAKSIQTQVAEEVPTDPDAGKKVNFATEPYRHDVVAQYFSEQTVQFGGKKLASIGSNGVLTLGDASQATNNPYQAQKSLGSF
jgi:hypothetical protein